MKQAVFAVAFSIISAGVCAQTYNDFQPSVTAKFSPAGIAVGKLTVGAEYNFKHKQSILVFAGIPFNKPRTITFDKKDSDVSTRASSMLAAYRYYLGNRDMTGFYAEAYLEYLSMEGKGIIHAELNKMPAQLDSRFTYKGYGAGLQLGYQVLIARRVALDLFILGPAANSSKFSSSSTDINDNLAWTLADADEAAADIKKRLADIPVVGDKIEVVVDKNAKTIYTSYNGFTPGLRFGASVGIRF
ncbi:MAG: DUF3575 domain-containing protein [Gemmatimonadaceae bacterium]|nr:DUF3575 domain-containing protein [Chitinophagaceae bacterium]